MDFQKMSDECLAEYIQENNGAGFEEIIDRYQNKLLSYSLRIIKDNDAAEDIVQETFIAAYRNINSFDVSRKFSSWIYRITHNKSINEINHSKKHLALEIVPEIPVDSKEQKEVEKKIDQKKAKEILEKAINRIPVKYSDPIILRFLEEKSYEEISDILQIPVGTVGVRIKRGLERLRKIITINVEDYL